MNKQTVAEHTGDSHELTLAELSELRASADLKPPVSPAPFYPTAERIEQEVSMVPQRALSPQLQEWVSRYSQVGDRPLYLWQWCCRGVDVTMLPCVHPEYRENVCDTKVLGVMLDVLMDDVADQHGSADYLEYLLSLPYSQSTPDPSRFSPEQQAYARFTAAVWEEIQNRLVKYPRYEEFLRQIRFDYQQLFNVMRYSTLLNESPELLNLAEHNLYLPHNMHMMVSGTMDLMCSPDFDRSEWGRVRQAVWYAQCMGRIGNLTTTWQREIGEKDFTSGVFAHAVSEGDLTVEDLLTGEPGLIEILIQQGGHEDHFLRRWQHFRRKLLTMRERVHSVDLSALVSGLEQLICLHLGSRGKK